MTTVLAILGSLLGLGGAVAAVVYYFKRAAATAVTLDQRDAALRVEQTRIDALEAAAAEQRAQSAREFNARANAARTADDAAELLRGQFPAASPPKSR